VSASASIGTLYVEELKALTRGHYAWLGAGVVLLAIAALATVGTQDTWLGSWERARNAAVRSLSAP
jgi:hypothetical protein